MDTRSMTTYRCAVVLLRRGGGQGQLMGGKDLNLGRGGKLKQLHARFCMYWHAYSYVHLRTRSYVGVQMKVKFRFQSLFITILITIL